MDFFTRESVETSKCLQP